MAKKRILHKINSNTSFFESLGRIIIDNHINSLDKIRIILPTGSLCSKLKDFLANNLNKASILPFICKIDDFYDKSKFVFSDKLRADPLEERIILTNIVLKHKTLAQNFSSAYNISKNLLEVFSQIHLNELSISDLKNYYFGEYSEYLVTVLSLIEELFVELEKKLLSINKISTFAYKKIFFELFRQKDDEHFIIAGIFNLDRAFLGFINNLYSSEFVYENCENEFLDSYLSNFKIDKINYISAERAPNSVHYMEFKNEYDEAKSVANIINEILTKDKNAKIAVINKDSKIDKILEANLKHFGVEIFSNTKLKVNESSIFNLFMHLSTFMINANENEIIASDIVRFLDILNNKYVKEEDAKLFEFELRNESEKNQQKLNFAEILCKNKKLSLMYQILVDFRKEIIRIVNSGEVSFKKILILNLESLEKICKTYPWKFEIGGFLSKFFNKLIECSDYINLIDIEKYIYVIKSLFRNVVYRNSNKTERNISDCVFNLDIDEVFIEDFDYVFMMDFNECSWDKNLNETILPKKIIDELNIPIKYKKEVGKLLIDFCLLKKNVFISRGVFKSSKSTTKASYLLKILNSSELDKSFINKRVLYKNYIKKHKIDILGEKDIKFPKNISISSVEKLINDPYSFYVEKILKLKKLEPIEKDFMLADFGNIIHYAIDEYTNSYPVANDIERILEKKFSKLPHIYKILWYKKAINILNDFTVFDLQRRLPKKIIKSEVDGMLKIKDKFGEINILGRADRIEIMENCISIVDFKTGTVPSSAKVKQGKFPQLIIESLMSKKNGFGFGIYNYATEIIYVKLSHKSSQLDSFDINISHNEYEKHEHHLKKLLNHFVQIKCPTQYPKSKSEDARFDNFVHLRRLW